MVNRYWNTLIVFGLSVVIGLVACVGVAPARADDDDPPEKKKKQEPIDPAEALDEISKLAEKGELTKALKVAERLAKDHPKNMQGRIAAAQLNHQVGIDIVTNGERKDANKYLFRCAVHMRAIHKLFDGKLQEPLRNFYAVAIYNQACSLAIDGKKEKALKILEESIDAGFDQLEILEKDTDFESVKDEEKFKELVKKLRSKKKIDT